MWSRASRGFPAAFEECRHRWVNDIVVLHVGDGSVGADICATAAHSTGGIHTISRHGALSVTTSHSPLARARIAVARV